MRHTLDIDLAAFVDDELSDDQRTVVLAHVKTCSLCNLKIARLAANLERNDEDDE